ncbi:hypothetical protein Tco_0719254 [Tanacetum coccineum]
MLAIQAEEGEGSGHPSKPQPPPSPTQLTNEEPIPNVVSSSHQKTQTPRQALNQVTELPQTSEPIPNVLDEAVYEEELVQVVVSGAKKTRSERKVESLEADLKQTKKVYGAAYTKLIKKVKKLEKTVKSNQARRREKIMVSDDEEDLDQEDQPEDQLVVFSAAKVLADATKENVHTYTRRRRAVSTGSGGISTASRLFSSAEESVSTVGASMPVSTAAQSFTEEEWENIKARVKADEELSRRLQAEERNRYSEVDQAKMLVDLINQRKKYFATQKAEAKRNKPMTQA